MSEQEQSTEEKILAAAEETFVKDGFEGARMQNIANKAGINKAMLHYYFRSKEMLFEKIFEMKSKFFFPAVKDMMKREDTTFIEKMEEFVEGYINFLTRYPFIPFFVVRTVNSSGTQGFIEKLPFKAQLAESVFISYQKDREQGVVAEIDPNQFLISVIGMCVFPFLGKPILKVVFEMEESNFESMMRSRIPELKLYIRKILTP
ncbi:TetR/AcrR family transcriptional regulator [Jiulongibacter sediminis]|uniref:TetR/AcrR family transcriptional regulator n=1 Tax=Jiulongibacter sediminis TaxID=1605367 RepID=UPI0006DCF78F|nr:TetR/AcrR family transcriptional regulator [Jiulongibacter sediminis]